MSRGKRCRVQDLVESLSVHLPNTYSCKPEIKTIFNSKDYDLESKSPESLIGHDLHVAEGVYDRWAPTDVRPPHGSPVRSREKERIGVSSYRRGEGYPVH